jgi:hypothetical protein
MNQSLNRKTGRKPEKTEKPAVQNQNRFKKFTYFLIENILKNPQIKWGQSHTTKSHIK